MSTNKRRVVVTGLGAISPVGLSAKESWESALKGISGITSIDHFDASDFPTRFCGYIRKFDVHEYIPEKEARKMDGFIHYGMAAGIQAVHDSGIHLSDTDRELIGVGIGAGMGGITGIENGHSIFLKGGARKISPFYIPSNIVNMISGNLSIKFGFQGPNFAIATACTTGTHNIGDAFRLIQHGYADVMIAGGAEMASSPTSIAGFASARALSRRNDSPQTASRPWDKDRDGFVLSDGAGVIVLEALESAVARSAEIYAEIVGFGMSADAYHMTQPPEDGDGAARCMRAALRDASLNPEQIDYINAHGTSTPAGDVAETRAVKSVFREHARRLAMSSTKSMTGHMLGAAGGIEAVFSVLALKDQVAPPTINLESPDPECDLDYVPLTARPMKIAYVLSNSFGFGGTNGSLIFKRFH